MHVIHFKTMLVTINNKFKLNGTKGHKKPFLNVLSGYL